MPEATPVEMPDADSTYCYVWFRTDRSPATGRLSDLIFFTTKSEPHVQPGWLNGWAANMGGTWEYFIAEPGWAEEQGRRLTIPELLAKMDAGRKPGPIPQREDNHVSESERA